MSFAALALRARAANDTTRAQINNIPSKSHVIPLLYYSVNLENVVVICPAAGKALKQTKYPQSENFVEFVQVAIIQRTVEETKKGFAAEQFLVLGIYHLHISHNTPCLPPKILHNLKFFISLGLQSLQEN